MVNIREAKSDQIAKGIGIILVSTFAMAFADAIVKLVSSDLTLWQVFVARSVFSIPCLTFHFIDQQKILAKLVIY